MTSEEKSNTIHKIRRSESLLTFPGTLPSTATRRQTSRWAKRKQALKNWCRWLNGRTAIAEMQPAVRLAGHPGPRPVRLPVPGISLRAILFWETDEAYPRASSCSAGVQSLLTTKLLLDGQQRLTSLALCCGQNRSRSVGARGLSSCSSTWSTQPSAFVTEVDEQLKSRRTRIDRRHGDDEHQQRLEQLTFVVATKKLERLPHWINVSDVFALDSDTLFEASSAESVGKFWFGEVSQLVI